MIVFVNALLRNIVLNSTMIVLSVSFFSTPLIAAEEQLQFQSAKQEALYDSLIIELRCLVCQNQNIADSNADLAKDLRKKTYELIQAGQTEAQIKQFMRDRYGDFVLYEPPLDKKTWLLWLGPFVMLLIVMFLVGRFIKQQSKITPEENNFFEDEELEESNIDTTSNESETA